MKSFRIDTRKNSQVEQEMPNESPELQPWLMPPTNLGHAPRLRAQSEPYEPKQGSNISNSWTPLSSPITSIKPSFSMISPPRRRTRSHESEIYDQHAKETIAKHDNQTLHEYIEDRRLSLSPTIFCRLEESELSLSTNNDSITSIDSRNTPNTNNLIRHREMDYDLSQEKGTTTKKKAPSITSNFSDDAFSNNVDNFVEYGSDQQDNESQLEPQPKFLQSSKSIFNRIRQVMKYCSYCFCCDSTRSFTRTSSLVVRYAPCFLCCDQEVSATDRAILFRLNILCALFAFVQVGAGAIILVGWYTNLFKWMRYGNDDDNNQTTDTATNITTNNHSSQVESVESDLTLDPNIWNLNLSLISIAFIGLLLLIAVVLARKVVKEVDLVNALRYYWFLAWVLPVEVFLVLTLFDAYGVTGVWVKHWWRSESFSLFRDTFCANNTSTSKCLVPENGGITFDDARSWCNHHYNATDCWDIRSEAEERMKTAAYAFYTVNGAWGVLLIILLFLSIRAVEGIITTPIVQSAREGNIAGWFTVPIMGCITIGSSLLFSPMREDENVGWIAITYFFAGGSFLFTAMSGTFISNFSVLNTIDKKRKEIAVILHIISSILTIIAIGAVLATSMVYSVDLVDFEFSADYRSNIACILDRSGSCTNCDNNDDAFNASLVCPEWTEEDVLKILRTILKQSACLATMLLVYAFEALRFGFVLRQNLLQYQIDYV